jgi:hypothetical protein
VDGSGWQPNVKNTRGAKKLLVDETGAFARGESKESAITYKVGLKKFAEFL